MVIMISGLLAQVDQILLEDLLLPLVLVLLSQKGVFLELLRAELAMVA
jgi:hypothetical protein